MSTMKQRKLPKAPCNYKKEVDLISELPAHVIDIILSKLSLCDAGRTSILSSKWRYKWSTIPYLVFDEYTSGNMNKFVNIVDHKFVNIVDHVLMVHDGPIQRISLSHSNLKCVKDINRWILFLSQRFVKELVLKILLPCYYEFPSSLYLWQNLVHLELYYCILKPPVTFNGFKTIKSLHFHHIVMEQNAIEYMISCCPLLERLTLNNVFSFTNLEINAPNLVSFDFTGDFETINFRDTRLMHVVSITLWGNYSIKYNLNSGTSGNLIYFFSHLPLIQRLSVKWNFLKYLSAGKVPRKLPTPCLELRFLSLCITFIDTNVCLAALCLLRSCPNLKELEVLSRTWDWMEEETGFEAYVDALEDDNDNCPPFNHLNIVTLVRFSGVKHEVNFIKYILANSPVLEKMIIKDSSKELMEELLLLKRISVQSQIIFP